MAVFLDTMVSKLPSSDAFKALFTFCAVSVGVIYIAGHFGYDLSISSEGLSYKKHD